MAGLILDPWQQLALDCAMGEKPNGDWQSFEVGIVVSRQNGKGSILEARELASLFLLDEELCIHSAHQFDTSSEHLERMINLIEGSSELTKKVRRVNRSHGTEGITVYRDGCERRLRFRTRTKGGGRGFTCDCLVFDEAMYLRGKAVGAMLPTLSAVPNPQVWYTGSAAPDREEADQLGGVRERAIAGGDPRLTYLEWSVNSCNDFCPKLCEEHDPVGLPNPNDDGITPAIMARESYRLIESYRKSNPGLNIRLTVEKIEVERRSMPVAVFKQERLGVGDWPIRGEAWRVIPKEAWGNAVDMSSEIQGSTVLAIDTSPDNSYSCITVAGPTTTIDELDGVHLEITGDGMALDYRYGTKWVVGRVKEIVKKKRNKVVAVVIDKASQAGQFVVELEALGIEVLTPTGREYAQACGEFGTAVVRHSQPDAMTERERELAGHSGGAAWFTSRDEDEDEDDEDDDEDDENVTIRRVLVHRDQQPLNSAVAGAEKRDLADMWAWSKRSASVDISPLVSATLALWGFKMKSVEKEAPAPWAMWG